MIKKDEQLSKLFLLKINSYYMQAIKLSIVIPVYNAANSIELVVKAIFNTLKQYSLEVILVNDFSNDDSWEVIQKIIIKNSNVIGINLLRNFGQQNATMAGIKQSTGDFIITLDDDLQHPPEEITKLVDTILENNYELVFGIYKSKKHNLIRNLGSIAVGRLINRIVSSKVKTSSFRIMTKTVAGELSKIDNSFIVVNASISRIVSHKLIGQCLVEHRDRSIGTSNYNFRKLFIFALNMIFNYTIWPLRLASISGILGFFVTLIIGLYTAYAFVSGTITVPGYTSTLLIMSFFSSILLFSLGIIGEYIGRIYLNIIQSPQFSIKEIITAEKH
jgi:polyisoprenyl-phosphate glycosyltransferase